MRPAAYALVEVAALQHNLLRVRQLAPGAKIMAVVKANGYGHGLTRVAAALKGVDAFAVARVDEGVRLRQAGIETRIAVLEGFTGAEELELHCRYRLESVIHAQEQLELLGASLAAERLPVWLKLDTGMNRLGFPVRDFKAVFERLGRCGGLGPVHLMTHLSHADDLEDERTRRQIASFREVAKDFEGECSIANSAGILGWEDARADWVRPGVMLYGVSPFPESSGKEIGVRPAMSLHSRVIAVKPLEAGDSVGYGGEWICSEATRLGVIAVGYGDGYPRHARHGTPVLVNGRRVPLVGRVSMDMIAVDLGRCPEARPGDPVVLWGEELPVEEVARCADTIPYTLLCGITQRVPVLEQEEPAAPGAAMR